MRKILVVAAAAFAFFALPVIAVRAADRHAPPDSIHYYVATRNTAIAVPPAMFATYVGSCLNADAKTTSYDESKRNLVYVCLVRPKIISEMENLKFLPNTVGLR